MDWINFDHVIAIFRGSLLMATHLSNIRDVPMSIVGFQTRDGSDKEPYWIHNNTKEVHDYEKYYLGNIIEYCNAEYKSNKHYKFPNINNKEYNKIRKGLT